MARTNTDFYKRIVSINITYQYCPERQKLKTRAVLGRKETRKHIVLAQYLVNIDTVGDD